MHVYTDREWNDIKQRDYIDPLLKTPVPKNEVWRCTNCDRIYVFNEDNTVSGRTAIRSLAGITKESFNHYEGLFQLDYRLGISLFSLSIHETVVVVRRHLKQNFSLGFS